MVRYVVLPLRYFQNSLILPLLYIDFLFKYTLLLHSRRWHAGIDTLFFVIYKLHCCIQHTDKKLRKRNVTYTPENMVCVKQDCEKNAGVEYARVAMWVPASGISMATSFWRPSTCIVGLQTARLQASNESRAVSSRNIRHHALVHVCTAVLFCIAWYSAASVGKKRFLTCVATIKGTDIGRWKVVKICLFVGGVDPCGMVSMCDFLHHSYHLAVLFCLLTSSCNTRLC